MKYTLHSELARDKRGGVLVVLNGLPAHHDVTMTPAQVAKLAAILKQVADAAEQGAACKIEHEYSVL